MIINLVLCYNYLTKFDEKSGAQMAYGAIERVLELYSNGIRPGTEVTRGILKNLNSPQKRLKIIHVAGTNGKGSVCEYLTRILVAAGKKVGTFTSPAVYDYCEQFKLDGVNMQKSLVESYLTAALEAADGLDATGFEVETAAALYAFCREGCEFAVIECGMGGLYDATNALDEKQAAIITSIGLEHTAFLGETIEEICAHKAGIIKSCPAVVNVLQPKEAYEYFKKRGVTFADKRIKILEVGLHGQAFSYGKKHFELSMAGCAQPYNAACAIEAARILKISENAIYSGVKAAKLEARLEVLRAGGNIFILDGAHNPSSFVPLVEFVKSNFGKVGCAVFGCLSDKDLSAAANAVYEIAERVIAVKPQSPRAADYDKMCAELNARFKQVLRADSVSEAVCTAAKLSDVVAVCGTFTILGEAKKWIEKR